MEGVLRERSEASDERCLIRVRRFSLVRVPGFIVKRDADFVTVAR